MPRICLHCGTANDNRATFCGACATQMVSTSTALVPVRKKSGLPVLSQKEKATLGSVALGLAAVAIRVGASLLKQVAEEHKPSETTSNQPAPQTPPSESSIRIRRRWVVGDRYGPLRWGEEEIEIDDNHEDRGSYRIRLR
ncbi:MAG: zinc ribbon domain-containing protein [Chloroflexota bacterium]|nr:zinc ribbon domain-containing protein [Chloroflexota bacterium]